ncbi:MAG TPA: MotA/TolQ/ExbB proton channel family protein, partial [Byssovorax sp.]
RRDHQRGVGRPPALELLSGGDARIGPEGAAEIVDGIDALRGLRSSPSFLVERVRRVLAQFASRGEVAQASAANDAESDADAAAVAASYATVKVLVWAMPILGLIGTVIGLSGAVGAFSHAMSGAEQLDTIKDSLRQVTTGLAVAFDATFVALVASILVMLPMTWLQKAEDKLVNDVDDYCITRVLARLGEPARAAAPAASHDALAADVAALGAALARTAPALEHAAEQLARATAAAEPTLARVAAAAASIDRAEIALRETSSAALPTLERAVAMLERAASEVESRVAPSLERAATQLADTADRADRAAAQADRTRDQLGRELGASRQLLSLLAASLGAGEAAQPKHHVNGNGAHAASGGALGS